MSDEEEIAVDPIAYPQEQDTDEQRRAYVLDCMTQSGDAPSIDGRIFVANMNLIAEWLRSGTVQEPDRRRPRAVGQPSAQP